MAGLQALFSFRVLSNCSLPRGRRSQQMDAEPRQRAPSQKPRRPFPSTGPVWMDVRGKNEQRVLLCDLSASLLVCRGSKPSRIHKPRIHQKGIPRLKPRQSEHPNSDSRGTLPSQWRGLHMSAALHIQGGNRPHDHFKASVPLQPPRDPRPAERVPNLHRLQGPPLAGFCGN